MHRSPVAILACFSVIALGCQSSANASRSDLAGFEQSLRLTITPHQTSIDSGQDLRLDVRITNVSDRTVETCLGSRRVANFWGLDEKYAKVTVNGRIADHMFCEQRVSLPPGETHEWIEPFTVPTVPPGRCRVYASVDLVSTKNCDRYGCDYIVLSGKFEPLLIVAPSN
jgi:hypothetical protein